MFEESLGLLGVMIFFHSYALSLSLSQVCSSFFLVIGLPVMVKLQITYLLVIGIAFVRMYVNVRGVFQNMADEIQT